MQSYTDHDEHMDDHKLSLKLKDEVRAWQPL